MKTITKIMVLTIAAVAAASPAFAGGMNGEYGSGSIDYIVPAADSMRFLVEQVLLKQNKMLLLQVRDLKTGQSFQYWVTEDQIETGTDSAQFLKDGVIPREA